ncbi:YkyA family protein [Paenisporosarcina sp. TG20]|uniref:YkyA family protein n=1 Tax=Paenisporosarcina sp. TG20 TaxID=1211706 RepID=UPI00031E2ED5|nr:YkyA family protein [Paenisporosarcina sp. TG20]
MKKIILSTFLTTSLLLSACSLGDSTVEQLSVTLSNVFEEEKGYRDAQQQLNELEKAEQEMFNSVMSLTQKQKEEVALKTDELKESLAERLVLLNLENESIENAQASLSSFDAIVEETKQEEIKTSLLELRALMEERYQAHKVVSAEYQELTDLQSKLYDMLINEDTQQVELQEQVAKVNAQNDIVQSAINDFNEKTQKVNEKKTAVYESLEDKN